MGINWITGRFRQVNNSVQRNQVDWDYDPDLCVGRSYSIPSPGEEE
jgi:hypothetical protein